LPNGNAGSREGNRGGFVVLLGPPGGGDLSGGYAPSQQFLAEGFREELASRV
jgi:hypothetical protein